MSTSKIPSQHHSRETDRERERKSFTTFFFLLAHHTKPRGRPSLDSQGLYIEPTAVRERHRKRQQLERLGSDSPVAGAGDDAS